MNFQADIKLKPNGKDKANPTTLAAQVLVDACIALTEFGPYVYAASPKTCSFYIKFSQLGLGGLRISNHKSKYQYKWNIRVNDGFKDAVIVGKNSTQYHAHYKNKTQFFEFMRETFNK